MNQQFQQIKVSLLSSLRQSIMIWLREAESRAEIFEWIYLFLQKIMQNFIFKWFRKF